MPELPEVEKAARIVENATKGKKIESVETKEDTIVFDGATHQQFADELTGRTVLGAHRYGKCFYIDLDGEGRKPVLHFGMTGMVQVKGQVEYIYKSTPKNKDLTEWPPKFWKFILHLSDPASPTAEHTQLAFLDARRLGRVRLRAAPLKEPPISELGFDPILSMPSLSDFTIKVQKRSRPIKALLLDQSFSAGVGNWVADEILYNARIHPEQKANSLSEDQLKELYHQTQDVCKTAVAVNADSHKFPEHWLFKHRWGKGKKEKHTLKLSSGEPATIKWITVGGRTSAYVPELQYLSGNSLANVEKKTRTQDLDDESDLTGLSEFEAPAMVKGRKRKAATQRTKNTLVRRGKNNIEV